MTISKQCGLVPGGTRLKFWAGSTVRISDSGISWQGAEPVQVRVRGRVCSTPPPTQKHTEFSVSGEGPGLHDLVRIGLLEEATLKQRLER